MDINKKIIIDVRSKEEYEENLIEKAINIPLEILLNIENEILKNRIVYLYCLSGNRSKTALACLTKKKVDWVAFGRIDEAGKIISNHNI